MKKDLTRTPRYMVRQALRHLWLKSRERSTALKRENYTCEACGRKQTKRKGQEVFINVHHRRDDIDWEKMIDYVYRQLLCEPDKLMVLCQECHDKEHGDTPTINDDAPGCENGVGNV